MNEKNVTTKPRRQFMRGEVAVDSARVAVIDPLFLEREGSPLRFRDDGSIVFDPSGVVVGYWTPTGRGDGVFPVVVAVDPKQGPERLTVLLGDEAR